MNYLQKVFLFMCLSNFITSSGKEGKLVSNLNFPYEQVNFKGICEEVITSNLTAYGEQTIFYDFYMNFTEEDSVDLKKLEKSFTVHQEKMKDYLKSLTFFSNFMTLEKLKENKEMYYRIKLNFLAHQITSHCGLKKVEKLNGSA